MDKGLQTINERIAEKIGSELIDLIPTEQWQSLVDTEIRKFKKDIAPKIIQEILQAKYKEVAVMEISNYCTTDEWNELTGQYTSTALTKLLTASGGEIFAGVMSPAMSTVMNNLRQQFY